MSAPQVGEYTWLGVCSGKEYRFHGPNVPPSFLDAYGNPLQRVPNYNGEVLIMCLPFGMVQLGSAAAPPVGQFGPGYNPGLWEREVNPRCNGFAVEGWIQIVYLDPGDSSPSGGAELVSPFDAIQSTGAGHGGVCGIELWGNPNSGFERGVLDGRINSNSGVSPSFKYAAGLTLNDRGDLFVANVLPWATDGKWHHVVWTFQQAAGYMAIYGDGVLLGSSSGLNLTIPVAFTSAFIGDSDGYQVTTELQHIQIFNLQNIALYSNYMAADTVSKHFSFAGTEANYLSMVQNDGAVHAWPLNDLVGSTTAVDIIGGLNGSVVDGGWAGGVPHVAFGVPGRFGASAFYNPSGIIRIDTPFTLYTPS